MRRGGQTGARGGWQRAWLPCALALPLCWGLPCPGPSCSRPSHSTPCMCPGKRPQTGNARSRGEGQEHSWPAAQLGQSSAGQTRWAHPDSSPRTPQAGCSITHLSASSRGFRRPGSACPRPRQPSTAQRLGSPCAAASPETLTYFTHAPPTRVPRRVLSSRSVSLPPWVNFKCGGGSSWLTRLL